MQDDPLWINVAELMQARTQRIGRTATNAWAQVPEFAVKIGEFSGRLNQILGIRDIEFHVEEVNGSDKPIDVVVDIFNRVNSGGTKTFPRRPGPCQDLRFLA